MIKSRLFTAFIQWLYPNKCVFCNRYLKDVEADCCELCYNEIKIIDSNYCVKCGKLHELESELCFDCSHEEQYFVQGRGMFVYEGLVKKALFGLKFFKKTWIGKRFGNILAGYYQEQDLWEIDMVIPVPLHRLRDIERGYNQAELIANAFGKQLDIQVYSNLLKRVKATEPQKDLGDDNRHKNMLKAFDIKDSTQVVGKRILLIDDIYTTGATINGCAKILNKYGANEIYFLTVAIGKGF